MNFQITKRLADGLTLKSINLHRQTQPMPCFIPIINSVASAHLTPSEWLAAKLTIGVLDVPQLYLKPGAPCLTKFYNDGANFFNWHGITCLNGKNDVVAQYKVSAKNFKIHSTYDGSTITYSASEVLAMAQLLQADLCILPSYLGHAANRNKLFKLNQYHLNDALTEYAGEIPLLVEFDLLQQQALCNHQAICGYVYDANSYTEPAAFLAVLTPQTQLLPDSVHYVIANYDWQQILQAIFAGADCIQSDKPASDGAQGLLYSTAGNIDINSEFCAQWFSPIDADCDGYCCTNFTIAYLHHLYKHNVLLGIKLQVLHNLHFVNSMIATLLNCAEPGRLREFRNKYMMLPLVS